MDISPGGSANAELDPHVELACRALLDVGIHPQLHTRGDERPIKAFLADVLDCVPEVGQSVFGVGRGCWRRGSEGEADLVFEDEAQQVSVVVEVRLLATVMEDLEESPRWEDSVRAIGPDGQLFVVVADQRYDALCDRLDDEVSWAAVPLSLLLQAIARTTRLNPSMNNQDPMLRSAHHLVRLDPDLR